MKTRVNKFGFEIEGEFSEKLSRKLSSLGSVKGDGSVRNCPDGTSYHDKSVRDGVTSSPFALETGEFASDPIERVHVRGTKKIFQLLDDGYKTGQFHWNSSCGFHVHVSFRPQVPAEIFSSQFCNFFYEEMQKTFPKEYVRRSGNRFCIATYTDREIAGIASVSRYKGINLWPSMRKHKTVEFRIWPGAKPMKMYDYLKFTITTIEKFIKVPIIIPFEVEIEEQEFEEHEITERKVNITEAFEDDNAYQEILFEGNSYNINV